MRGAEGQLWSLLSQWWDWGNGLELHQEWLRLGVGKMFFTRGLSGPRTGSQGSGHSPRLVEIKEHLASALRHRVWIWMFLRGTGSWTQWFFVVPFQIRIFYDSMILRHSLNFFFFFFFFSQAFGLRRAHLNPSDVFQGDKICDFLSFLSRKILPLLGFTVCHTITNLVHKAYSIGW